MRKTRKMLKRITCGFLAAAMIITQVPLTSMAQSRSNKYGDVNGDGEIDAQDASMLMQYLVENKPSGFESANADVNGDQAIDLKDLLLLEKYLAGWDVTLGVKPETLTVSFYDGDRLIDSLSVEKDSPLKAVPSVAKSSKANAVLLGYYTDKDCTAPFYAENPVTENMKVYAKYQKMGGTEELNLTSFAQMDQSTDLFFEIMQISGNIAAADAAELIVKDGSDPVALSIADPDKDGVYTVSAVGGFGEGCSYEVTLAEGWIFKGKESTIRTAAFSIAMKEVENLKMSDNIVYIKDTDTIDYKVQGTVYEELTTEGITEQGGEILYEDADADSFKDLAKDDIICIYVGVKPTERDTKNGSQLLDPAVYVKITDIKDGAISFTQMGSEDQIKLYDIPDNFPIATASRPAAESKDASAEPIFDFTKDTGSVNIKYLDRDMYALMMGETDGTYEKALEKIGVGDFITVYTSKDEITSDNEPYYAEITAYNSETGEITYKKTTEQAITDSMDLYAKINISGDDLVTEEEKKQIEDTVLSQLEQSSFTEEAAYLLSDMITKTDGFRNNMSVKEFLLTDENGRPLSDEEIQLLNLGKSFELSDKIKLKVELITNGDQLHFGGGVQLAVKVEAKFEVEVEDGKIAIDLSATFVQEVALSPTVKGSIVKKKVLFIPVPIGVQVNAAIDIRNYTAFSFAAEIYTVAEEDQKLWDKIKEITKDPKELLGLSGLPDGLANGLKTAGDVMNKIDELKEKINQASETAEKIEGYKKDVEALWDVVESNGLTTKKEWEEMEEKLQKTSIASDLLDLMDMTTETEISTEYLDSVQALMDKYSEMLQKETDWVELVNKEIVSQEICVFGLAIGVETNFIVRADMSIAIGSNLEYEVGKRYSFWFKIGLFKPTAGSSTMDLIDEKFAFQFYVMGKLGLKAGVRAKLYVGLGSGKLASVGITAELGPYVKLYGFFVYEYTKYRPVNTQSWTSKERMAGALYLEFGLYFMLGFEASALGNLFEYSYDFLDEEVPLLTAGESRYYYGNAYEPQDEESVIVRDVDGNSANGITMVIPDNIIALNYVDLDTGLQASEAVDYKRYHFTVSNPNFKVNPDTGEISVTVPENTRYMECDLTVTYLYGKLAFSQYDMSVTVPLVWTNLSTDELKEFYTASVRVGNDKDGYQTVWSKRVLKNQEYDLPTDAEIKEMIGWNDAKYIAGTGYGSQKTTGLTLIRDQVYDYNVNYKTYSVTVDGIENADGTTRSAVYTAKYGEKFDFSDLAESGTEIAGKTYKKFAGVETDVTIEVAGQKQVIDLTQNISNRVAAALEGGIHANAKYIDDSVIAIFEFTGIALSPIEQRIRKGTTPSLDDIGDAVVNADPKLDIVDISPLFGKTNVSTVYQVICGELSGPKATIVFHENGGSDVLDITKVVGSFLGTLPKPTRTGYSFDGWYLDNGTFRNLYEERKMTEGGANLYAKWTANEYLVTFHVNGGNDLSTQEKMKAVTYDSTYGALPVPTRSGYAFLGWFTAEEGGTEVTAGTKVTMTQAQTLYAHWRLLKVIDPGVFNFGETENPTYQKGQTHEVLYTFNAGEESFVESDFTFKYMRQGNSDYETGLPVNAGTYNVTVSRPADDIYDKFEYTYSAVITIEKAVRTISTVQLEVKDKGYTYLKLAVVGNGGIDDLSSEATFTYQAKNADGAVYSSSANRSSNIYELFPGCEYFIFAQVKDDPNYYDAESAEGVAVSTLEVPSDNWFDHCDTSWYNSEESTFEISSAEQLAGLSMLTYDGTITFSGKTIILTADIDLRGHEWTPIGWTDWFKGTFDGRNHKITGLYLDESYNSLGLFRYVGGGARIANVLLDHSYIRGMQQVGGIAGYAANVTIDNCVNCAYIKARGTDYNGGGILGRSTTSSTRVINCVNYGTIDGYGEETGGIVGFVDAGTICNNANFGRVDGITDVGGIVGQANADAGVYNNFSAGRVIGTKQYIGGVVGRVKNNDGTVKQGYYLRGYVTCSGSSRNGIGTEKSSLSDGDKGFEVAYFTSPTSTLSRSCDAISRTNNILSAMNTWVDLYGAGNGAVQWVAEGRNGYPIPVNSPTPDDYLTRGYYQRLS